MKKKKMATLLSDLLSHVSAWGHHRAKLLVIVGLSMLFLGVASCDPTMTAYTNNVEIDIEVKHVSAGFAQVRFSTNKDAFYLISIQPAREDINPQDMAKTFMLLSLDSAYADYLYWRNKQLQQLTPFVADFSSHSLQYGNIEHFFTMLQPNTEYWVYAFVVDANTNKPAGKLFLETITTKATSSIPVYFEYRIDGYWDYIYPKDTLGKIISTIPWVGETMDSVSIREDGWRVPGEYFFDRFKNVYTNDYERILYGIYAYENNGEGDDTSITRFEVGKTYYTAMAALDAPLVFPLPENIYNIYRFTWQGDTTNLYFTPEDCTGGAW